jgi:hypothetical protein
MRTTAFFFSLTEELRKKFQLCNSIPYLINRFFSFIQGQGSNINIRVENIGCIICIILRRFQKHKLTEVTKHTYNKICQESRGLAFRLKKRLSPKSFFFRCVILLVMKFIFLKAHKRSFEP